MTPPAVVRPASSFAERTRSERWSRIRAGCGRHRVFLAVFVAGAALRVVTLLAYRPALLYIDSFKYLDNLHNLDPSGIDPIGYDALFLRPVLWIGNLATVAATQHAMGLLMGVAIYVVLLRNGVRPWIAAVAAIPVLLDAYQLQIEQNVMSDTLFEALVLGVVVVLCWNRKPGYRALAAAGALLGVAITVRLVGIPLVVPLVVFAALTGAGWVRLRRGAVVVLAFAIPVLAYASYYDHMTGRFAITTTDAGAIYARAVVIVDCPSLSLPSYERVLCPKEPIGKRPGDRYAHDGRLLARIRPPRGMTPFQVERDFARRVFVAQPLDLAGSVLGDFAHGFGWSRTSGPTQVPVSRWQFQTTYPRFPNRDPVPFAHRYGGGGPAVDRSLAQFLRDYQSSIGFVPGPFLALALAVGLLGALGVRRARRSGLRGACFLASALGLGVLLTADMFEFSWRYQLPGLLLVPLAGALGVTALRTGSRRLLPAELDDVDQAAIAAFRARNGDVQLAPVAVVIAAYEEEDTIGVVLDELPAESCGLRVQPLVVVDGVTDATADVARSRGALVCSVAVNRGQGAALRLGYYLARTGGARFIVTTDADGQYDATQLPRLLAPLVDDEADFVTGSRWLGHQETTDRVRRAGSWFFARLATLLTGHRVTDTSFGFRAMTADVTARVTLRQPQYQSSELLIGALAMGFRVAECPMTIRTRTGGRTKKGNNLAYGIGFACALIGTWVRTRLRNGEPRAHSVRAQRAETCATDAAQRE